MGAPIQKYHFHFLHYLLHSQFLSRLIVFNFKGSVTVFLPLFLTLLFLSTHLIPVQINWLKLPSQIQLHISSFSFQFWHHRQRMRSFNLFYIYPSLPSFTTRWTVWPVLTIKSTRWGWARSLRFIFSRLCSHIPQV